MNLFWSTRSLTESREDHLTEFFAAALAHVPSFRAAYADLVLSRYATELSWPTPVIERVETQPEFAGTGCRPDLLLHLEGGRLIACEHKLEAPETPGAEDDRGQLERYLDLPIDGVVYVRRAWLPPGEAVLSNPKYVRPAEKEHFLWSDFFPLLGPGQHLLIDWLREGFEWLGYTPPDPNVGELTLRPEGDAERAMLDFAKLWNRVRTSSARMGWTVQNAAKIQVYLLNHKTSPVWQVLISPESQGEFLVRFTPHDEAHLDATRAEVARAAASLGIQTRLKVASGSKKGQKVKVVDVRASRSAVLGMERQTVEDLEARLLRFVEPLVVAVSR